jgi:hypothetical protein
MKFDIHISRNFKGGQYLTSFNANSSIEVLNSIKQNWIDSGVNNENSEGFLFAEVDGHSKMYEIATFAFDSDDDLSWEMNLDDANKMKKWLELGYVPDDSLYGIDLFKHFIEFLLSK